MSNVWSGHLNFALVSMPVRLAVAARSESISFNQIHKAADGSISRIEQKVFSKTDRCEVSRDSLLKGYEYDKGQYVVIDAEDLKKAAPKTATTMEILEFVNAGDVDAVYFESSYYVQPEDAGKKAYALLFAALRKSGKFAIAKVAMHSREHIVILRAAGKGIMLHTMFYRDEIREAAGAADESLVSEAELAMAMMLVDQKTAAFDPTKYSDGYKTNVQAMIQAKIAEIPSAKPADAKLAPVVDIMSAIRASLNDDKKPAEAASKKRAKKVGA